MVGGKYFRSEEWCIQKPREEKVQLNCQEVAGPAGLQGRLEVGRRDP